MKAFVILFLFVSILACQSGQAKLTPADLDDLRYSEQNAVIDAKAALAKGDLYLLRIGELMRDPQLDTQTGLRIETLGCEGSEAKDRYIKKYNEVITQSWKEKQKKP